MHIVEHNRMQWRKYLLFRELLRQNPGIRKQYAEIKNEIGKRFQDDRKSYTAAKHEFVRGILEINELNQSLD
ncbi:MAG: GrpB family protein [Pseudomonadota bacterium]